MSEVMAANEKSAAFQLSADASALIRIMEKAQVNQVLTYKELSEAIGRTVVGGTGCAKSAVNSLRRDKRMIFEPVRGVGYMRLSDSSIVDLSDKAIAHSRRHARRTVKKLICVNYNALPHESQTKHNTALSTFGVLSELTSRAGQTRLEQRVKETGTSIPVALAAIAAIGN